MLQHTTKSTLITYEFDWLFIQTKKKTVAIYVWFNSASECQNIHSFIMFWPRKVVYKIQNIQQNLSQYITFKDGMNSSHQRYQ